MEFMVWTFKLCHVYIVLCPIAVRPLTHPLDIGKWIDHSIYCLVFRIRLSMGAHLNESNQLLKISTHDWLQFLVECNFEKVESCIAELVLTFDTIIYLDNIFLLHNSEFYAQTFNTLYSIISFSNSINELE